MYLIADGVGIVAGRGDQKVKRLHPGVPGALEHDVKEFPVRLGMQLIEDYAVGIKAMLVRHIRRKHLVGAVSGKVGDLLLGFQDLYPLGKRRTEPHHIHRHIKHDLCLVAVSGAAIHLSPFLAIPTEKQERHGGGKLRFALFLGDLDICCIKLTVAIGL